MGCSRKGPEPYRREPEILSTPLTIPCQPLMSFLHLYFHSKSVSSSFSHGLLLYPSLQRECAVAAHLWNFSPAMECSTLTPH